MKLKAIDYSYILFILFTIIIYFNSYSLNVDSTWILYSAKKMINGSVLYVDMIDVNPPLIFMYSIIPVLLHKIIPIIDISHLYIILVIFIVSISTFLCIIIIKNTKIYKENTLRYFFYSILFIETIVHSYNFGQREHLFIIFILPYIINMMHKEKTNLSFFSIVIIALFASLGFNLKPHFFIIFCGVELVYLLHKKSFKAFFRIDSIIILFSSILFILIIKFYFPEYFSFIIPFGIDLYIPFFNNPLKVLLLNYEIIILILAIIFAFIKKEKLTLENKILIVASLSSLIIYLLQQKGFNYHRIPVFTLVLLFLIHITFNKIDRYSFYSVLFIPFILTISYSHIKYLENYNYLEEIINKLPSKSSVLVISADIAQCQPILKKEQIWASRFTSFFMLHAMLKSEKKEDIKSFVFNAVYEDLKRYKPDHIILPLKNQSFDYYQYFVNEDTKIKIYFQNNYKIKEINNYKILFKNELYSKNLK